MTVSAKKRPSGLFWILGFFLVLIIAIGGFFLITALTDPYDCRIVSGVTIGGLEVGGMTKSEARKALTAALDETLYATDLTVSLPEQTLTLSPANTKVKVDVRTAVNAAYDHSRKDTSASPEISILSYLTTNEDAIRALLTEYAAKYDTELTQPTWTLEGDAPELSSANFDPEAPAQTLLVTLGVPTLHLDVNEVYGNILSEYGNCIPDCRSGSFTVTPEVTPEALPDALDWDAISAEFCVEAVDDSLDMQTYQPISGSYGYSFDLDAAKSAVSEADWGETVAIPMTYVEPEILGEDVYFRDILGSCDTTHTNNENRNTNLRLVCEILNGLILQPGEEFSYNETIGERTEERGFKPAGAYSGNRLVNSIGGGVCQGSSTLYNCVLLADLEVTDRVCHGFTVGYLPIGLDAAVNWATDTDFKFRNSSHFPIMIQAELSDGYMKMKILGTDEKDYYIKMESTRSDGELRIYSNSYKCKYDKETGELISRDLEARSSYMYYED